MKETFYTVPEDAWLFKKSVEGRRVSDKKWTALEEFVRQWCIQELIRKYGVRIDCIEIERPIRVAQERKPHRADIVVLQNSRPHIIVECKSRQTKSLDNALKQAQNYAKVLGGKVHFVVATNGDGWRVCRRNNDEWTPVADLPFCRDGKPRVEWRMVLMAVQDLSPVLYWLDRPVPKKVAAHYFAALQRFFYCRNEISVSTDYNLLLAADRLLRVLSRVDSGRYINSKLNDGCRGLNNYWADHGIKTDFGGDDFWETVRFTRADLSKLIEDNADIPSLDNALLRVLLALFEYLSSLQTSRRDCYSEVPNYLQREIRVYLDLLLAIRFDAALPDPIDTTCLGDIHKMCEPAWLNFVKETTPGICDFFKPKL